MATQKEAAAALAKIVADMNQAGVTIGQMKVSLANVSADVKNLADQAKAAPGTQDIFDGLVAASAQMDAIGAQMTSFATATSDLAALTPDVDVPPAPPAGPPA